MNYSGGLVLIGWERDGGRERGDLEIEFSIFFLCLFVGDWF